MAQFIYSRVSTNEQDTGNQTLELVRRFPEAKLVEEIASGAKIRPKLSELLKTLGTGDTLIVYALDRLGRKCGELVVLLDDLQKRGIILVSVREGIDLGSIGGRFVAQIFAALGEMERNLISERTRTALAAKKSQGAVLGRPLKHTPAMLEQMRSLRSDGATVREISLQVGMSVGRVCELLKVPA
jgi:DNA invertase Pin-like site-specific DNA recombinase